MELNELYELMRERWSVKNFNDFQILRPDPKMIEDYIVLPATFHHVVIIYTDGKKVIMSIYWPKDELAGDLAMKITYSSAFYKNAQLSRDLPVGRDRGGPFAKALARYTAEMQRILTDRI